MKGLRQLVCLILFACVVALTKAFQGHGIDRRAGSHQTHDFVEGRCSSVLLRDCWHLWQASSSARKTFTHEQSRESPTSNQSSATVVRLAARKFHKDASKPSSKDYTTRKDSFESLTIIAPHGVQDDYNHYRTVALESTPDRAISFLTRDVMEALRNQRHAASAASDGDLGENVLVEGMNFDDVKVGQQYMIGPHVAIEVTEPMTPCGNLCKLPYINDAKLAPKERIGRCQNFLDFLDKPGDGFRGWYAKVIRPGEIHVGDYFQQIV